MKPFVALLLTIPHLFFPIRSLAQTGQDELEDEFALLEEELAPDEVASASKHRQPILWSPSAITVITQKEIRSSGANSIADLLRRVPGMDVYELKPSYPLVGNRSLTEESNNLILTLVDGREALMEYSGFTFWAAMTIDVEEVERVEIIRGPGSALYGANAYAAVVSIITVPNRPKNSGQLYLTGGEEGRYRLVGRARHHFPAGDGTFDLGITIGNENGRSASDRGDDVITIGLRTHAYARYRRGKTLDLSLHAGYVVGQGIYFTHLGDFRLDPASNYWEMAQARLGLSENSRLKLQFYHSSYAATFRPRASYRAYDTWMFDIPVVDWSTHSIDFQVQHDWQLGNDFMLITGANARYTTNQFENLIITDPDEARAAAFAHLQWSPCEWIEITSGARIDLTFEAQEKYAVSPRLVAVASPVEGHTLRLGYGHAFRKPSLFESQTHAKIHDYNQGMPIIAEKLAESIGNEKLVNEKVHSFEAGWRGRFLENRLRLSIDLFFNLYLDTITFVIDVPLRLGVPDIPGSTIQYQNIDDTLAALGGEAQASWSPGDSWTVWANLGLRRVTTLETGQRRVQEPRVKANLGARYSSGSGPLADAAVHYVSAYKMPLLDPSNLLSEPKLASLGDNLYLIARLGYRLELNRDREIEAGLSLRTPLGVAFREYAGIPLKPYQQIESGSDFAGDTLVRLISFYLRGSI